MTSRLKLIALVTVTLAAFTSGGTVNAGEPIPGVDIYLGKDGIAVVAATMDRAGRFSARVRVEPGEYVVTTACAPRRPCPSNRSLTLRVDDRPVRPDARGRYLFPVGAGLGTVMISGQVDNLSPIPRER